MTTTTTTTTGIAEATQCSNAATATAEARITQQHHDGQFPLVSLIVMEQPESLQKWPLSKTGRGENRCKLTWKLQRRQSQGLLDSLFGAFDMRRVVMALVKAKFKSMVSFRQFSPFLLLVDGQQKAAMGGN